MTGKTYLHQIFYICRTGVTQTHPITTIHIETYSLVVGPAIIRVIMIEGWLWLQGLFF